MTAAEQGLSPGFFRFRNSNMPSNERNLCFPHQSQHCTRRASRLRSVSARFRHAPSRFGDSPRRSPNVRGLLCPFPSPIPLTPRRIAVFSLVPPLSHHNSRRCHDNSAPHARRTALDRRFHRLARGRTGSDRLRSRCAAHRNRTNDDPFDSPHACSRLNRGVTRFSTRFTQ